MDPTKTLIDLVIGILAGTVGGIAGVGGSIVMLPALALVHGYETEQKARHHVYMAASMLVNIAVSLSSSLQHAKKGAARKDLVIKLGSAMCVGMVAGVLLSKYSPGKWAVVAFAVFIWAYCVYTLVSLLKKSPEASDDVPTPHWGILVSVGVGTGIVSGFLGIGGGILLVPLLKVAGLPLRHAIAGSAGVMWMSATIGAGTKLVTLPALGFPVMDAIAIAAPMGAGALAGAWFGAWLSHALRLPHLKVVIIVILSIAAARMVLS